MPDATTAAAPAADAEREIAPDATPLTLMNAELVDLLGEQVAQRELDNLQPAYDEAGARATANRFLRICRRIRGELAAQSAEYRAEKQRLDMVHHHRSESLSRRLDFLERALCYLYQFLPIRTGKSVKLIEGRLGMRQSVRAGIEIEDLTDERRAALIAWAQTWAPETVELRYKEGELKETLLALKERGTLVVDEQTQCFEFRDPSTGEVTTVPGVRYKAAEDGFYATPDAQA